MESNIRLKRILFRAAHRGTKESDLILGPYASAHAPSMPETALIEFEAFLEEGDNDIWDWISGSSAPENGQYTLLIEELRKVNEAP